MFCRIQKQFQEVSKKIKKILAKNCINFKNKKKIKNIIKTSTEKFNTFK